MKRLISVFAVLSLSMLVGNPVFAEGTTEQDADTSTMPEATQDDEVAQVEETISEEEDGEGAEVVLDDETEEEEAGSLIDPFSVSFSIDNTFSVGALFRDKYTVTNYNVMGFGLSVGYSTPVPSLSLGLGASYSKYLTESGGSVYQREGRFGDMSLSASYGSIFTDEWVTGINLSGSLSFKIPTSEMSRFTNLYTAISAGIGLSRSFGNLSLRYGLSFKKNFHGDTSVVADLDSYPLDVLARDGGNELISEAQVALDTGVLSSYSFINSLSISYSWFTGFSTGISWSFVDSFTYDNGTITVADEYTSEYAVVGRGHSQAMTGTFSVSYAFLDYFGASLALSTSQQPLTADNRRVRFPFWDLETSNLSGTSVSLGLSASY